VPLYHFGEGVIVMKNILIEGQRLRLRRAELADVEHDRNFQTAVALSDGSEKMSVIIEEIETAQPVGYFLLSGLDTHEVEWRHVIVDKKGVGYGRESFRLLMKWTFEVKKYHRAWLDCKDYNTVALNLYESSGLVREGLMRETLLTDGVYENLVVLGILDREYFADKV